MGNKLEKCCKSAQSGNNDIFSPVTTEDQEMADLLSEPSNGCPPFPPTIVGTFSNHGIQPGERSASPRRWFQSTPAVVKVNQDRGSIEYPFLESFDSVLFCVMDGHGREGEKVSDFCIHHLHKYLADHKAAVLIDPEAAFEKVFLTTHSKVHKATDINSWDSGTTAVAVYLKGHELFIANVGDSRAVLASRNARGRLKAKDLSNDHNPDSPGEFERLCNAGGVVAAPEAAGLSARVWTPNRQIGLSMARSLGDVALSKHGVIANPEITKHSLQAEDTVMIIGSDGIWEFMTSQEAVNIVSRHPDDATEACKELILTATKKWRDEEGAYRDDITAIVVYLDELLPNFVDGTRDTRLRAVSRAANSLVSEDTETIALALEPGAEGEGGGAQAGSRERRLSLDLGSPSSMGGSGTRHSVPTAGTVTSPGKRSGRSRSMSIPAPAFLKPALQTRKPRTRRRPSFSPDMDLTLEAINPPKE